MTPEILLRNLHHCYIKMEFVELLIFDECHHAQVKSDHSYAEIMRVKDFFMRIYSWVRWVDIFPAGQ